MLNLLRAQMYKLFRNKSFYLILFINLIIDILGVLLYWSIINNPGTGGGGPESVKGYSLMYLIIRNGGIEVFECISIVFVALFVASELKHGNIKSEISFGFKRMDIYFSRLISCIIGVSIIMACSMLTGLAAGTALFGFGTSIESGIIISLLKSFFLITFVTIAYCSVYVMLCFVLKEPGVIIGVYIGFTVLISNMLVAQLAMRFEGFRKITEYFLQSQLYNVAKIEVTGKTALTSVIYTLGVFVIVSVLGYKIFNKTDIA